MPYIRSSFFKETTEDWYGEFRIKDDARHVDKKYVHVTLHSPLGPSAPDIHRVSVWGNDDMGMEFDTADPMEARQAFFALAFLKSIDRKGLDLIGPFVPA